MEDFVPFGIALKLKEKGFKEKVNAYYGKWENLFDVHPALDMNDCDYRASAPTISQVFKWLREEYKIYMYVERDTYHLKFRFVYEKDKPRGKLTSSIYDTYEQAALAGIKYVLDNLI